MAYRNLSSIQASITSYLEAFNKMWSYCEKVKPSADQSNSCIILPTEWQPVGGYNVEKLRKEANYLYAAHASLLNFGKPRYLAQGYWDYDTFFTVSWQLRIPFNIYVWENAQITYPGGFDDEGNPIGEVVHIPAKMSVWCSPQSIKLGEISGWGMKSWALCDWRKKYDEIESFMDDNPNLEDQYRKAVGETDKEFKRWIEALEQTKRQLDIFV